MIQGKAKKGDTHISQVSPPWGALSSGGRLCSSAGLELLGHAWRPCTLCARNRGYQESSHTSPVRLQSLSLLQGWRLPKHLDQRSNDQVYHYTSSSSVILVQCVLMIVRLTDKPELNLDSNCQVWAKENERISQNIGASDLRVRPM